MTLNILREKYLNFFKLKGHAVIPSSSLIPENDSTLLFTNSGMFPLVPYLLGEKHPAGVRLTDSQKCLRSEDIEEVGDNRHNTFFEMLGNWSLGDYFKYEQLNWWYEFLVDEIKIDPSRLYQTVYAGDEKAPKDFESIDILKDIFKKYNIVAEVGKDTLGKGSLGTGEEIDFNKERIFAYCDKNWWQRGDSVGELGGPDSETFFDTGKKHDEKFGKYCHLNCDCGRFIEIGNSVFMQYQKTISGWKELSNKNVDFGGGLERILMATAGEKNVFKTSAFSSIIHKIEVLSGKKYDDDQRSFEIIADHIKSSVFVIGDDMGVSPSNVDQGYVVRRLLRRAMRYGRQLGITENGWMNKLAFIIIELYNDSYGELKKNVTRIFEELDKEEIKFSKTIDNGLKIINKQTGTIDGAWLFDLYQTHGFPLEMSLEEVSRNKNIVLVNEGDAIRDFNIELGKHQELSRTASAGKFKGGLVEYSEQTTKLHTATHLLLFALRKVLGDHIEQRGSNITAERLRFDFTNNDKLTVDQISAVESIVNKAISASAQVFCEEKNINDARKDGAIGIFDSKYGQCVKVYTIKNDNEVFSKEICGGPHVSNTAELGKFKIQKEESSSSGVRRIKAVLL